MMLKTTNIETSNQKVTSLKEWRQKKENFQLEKSFNEYLKILNFNELITESNNIINELQSNKLNCELTFKTKLILEEFNNRLTLESSKFVQSLHPIQKQIEKKIFELNKHL